jgi:tetratricopeptide (TPR) repeat protein
VSLPKGWNSKSTYKAVKREEKEDRTKEGDTSQRKKRALIVSISNYNNLEQLPFCQNDGKEMYLLLKSLGYEIFNDNRLIGGEVRYDDLRKGLIDLLTDDKNIHPQDTLLFYFSGHGLPDGYDGTYLATSDIDPDRPFDKGISFDDITRWMNISKSKRIISILDCCCSGSIGLTKGDENTTASLVRASMEKKSKILKEGEGKCILAASTGTQEAYGSKKQDHSIFTYHLLEGMRGASGESVDKYGNVTPELLSNYVYDKVTEQTSIKQKPVTKVDTSGRIILASYPELGKEDISNLITQGFKYSNRKDYLNAIECFTRVLALEPKNSFIWYIQGESFFNLNQFDKSIKFYEKAIEIDPNYDDAKNKIKLATQKLESFHNNSKFSSHEKIQKVDVLHNLDTLPKLSELQWENLLDSIDRKSCIPFIGSSALEFYNKIDNDAFLTKNELAKEWAKEYDYPFQGPYELPKVSQYVAITELGNAMAAKENVSRRFRRMTPPNFRSDKFSKSPHAILAELNLPIYITTNYDFFMEEALQSQGKQPRSGICKWNQEVREIVDEETEQDPFRPTSKEPLVFHFHGTIDLPESLVLTERDHQDFIINTNKESEKAMLPTYLRRALPTSTLLFIGYSLGDINFRSIFQGALSFMSPIRKRKNSIAVIEIPIENDSVKREILTKYMEKYTNHMFEIVIYWGELNEFLEELQTKWREYNNKILG